MNLPLYLKLYNCIFPSINHFYRLVYNKIKQNYVCCHVHSFGFAIQILKFGINEFWRKHYTLVHSFISLRFVTALVCRFNPNDRERVTAEGIPDKHCLCQGSWNFQAHDPQINDATDSRPLLSLEVVKCCSQPQAGNETPIQNWILEQYWDSKKIVQTYTYTHIYIYC